MKEVEHCIYKAVSEVAFVNPKLPNKDTIAGDVEVQFVPMKLVEEKVNKIHLTETKLYKEVQKGSYTPFINGDILFAKVTPCMENGKVAVTDNLKNGIGYGSSEFHVVRPKSAILNKYLFYFLVQDRFRNEAQNAMTGAVGLRRVPKQFIENYRIPIPPISAQQAIVSKIEELFSELDKGIENLQLAQQQLKTYRQSVLKWAFEGKLTSNMIPRAGFEPFNMAAEPAGLYKNKDTDNGELPEGWRWDSINNIGKIKGGKRLPPKHSYSEQPTDYVYIMAGNLKNGTVTNKPTYIRKETFDALSNYKVTGEEVYITIVGACIGDAGIIPKSVSNSILTENAAKIIDLKNVFNKYLALWINSTRCQSEIKSKILSATLGKLALNRIGMLEVPIPSLQEQYKIVAEIESRLSVADKMEESINQSLQQAEALRQSILKKAFEGKLILKNHI